MTTKMTPNQIFETLKIAALAIAKEENLRLTSISRRPKAGTVGTCTHDGHIKICIRTNGLMESVLWEENIRTIAHELAHLKHFNHSKEFYEYAASLVHKFSERLERKARPEIFFLR